FLNVVHLEKQRFMNDDIHYFVEVDKMISKDQVKHIADLARIAITEEEADMLTEHLRNMAVFKDHLSEVHTDGVQPTTHGVEVQNVVPKDEPKEWITQEEVLKNAPDKQDGQFRVPSILE